MAWLDFPPGVACEITSHHLLVYKVSKMLTLIWAMAEAPIVWSSQIGVECGVYGTIPILIVTCTVESVAGLVCSGR